MPFVTAFMRSSLNATAVDYEFLATQGVHAEHVMVDVLTPTSLLARLGQRSIDYVNVREGAHPPLARLAERGPHALSSARPAHPSRHRTSLARRRLQPPSLAPPPPHACAAATAAAAQIDVEAQEVSILKAWPFEGYCVDVFNVENQPPHGEPSILPQLLALLAP
eukprot:2378404-Prymnesium_polylepis.2